MSCSPSARRESKLLRQDIAANARPLLEPILSRQDAGIARLEADSAGRRKLMMLVRRNSHSALTCRNGIEIQQGGVAFYGSMVAEIEAARHSVHLQYSYGPRITFFRRCVSGLRSFRGLSSAGELALLRVRLGDPARMAAQAGGSLAGKDSMLASSTRSFQCRRLMHSSIRPSGGLLGSRRQSIT
jgi:hypothetical protein